MLMLVLLLLPFSGAVQGYGRCAVVWSWTTDLDRLSLVCGDEVCEPAPTRGGVV